jgi:hypothetical protein
MSKREIDELAAILVNEHGDLALAHARARRAEHLRQPYSEAFQVWSSIVVATARLLRARDRRKIRTG